MRPAQKMLALFVLIACYGCNTEDNVDGPAQLVVDPVVRFVAFEKIALNQTTTQTITVENIGQSPAKITDVEIKEGADDQEPELQQGANWQTQWVLEPGKKATFNVVWSPKNKTDDSGQLVITTDDPNNKTITIELETPEPTGDALSLSAEPAVVDFGMTGPGKSVKRTLQVSVSGDEQLKVLSTRFDVTSSMPDEFKVDMQPMWPQSYDNAQSFEVTLTYAPQDLVEDTGSFVIVYDGGEISVPLNATLSALVYDLSVDFGDQAKDGTYEEIIYLENTGDVVWTLGEAFIKYEEGDGAFDYSFPDPADVQDVTKDRPKGDLPIDIQPGAKLPVRVMFMPTDSVNYKATLKISGPVDPKNADIALSGKGSN